MKRKTKVQKYEKIMVEEMQSIEENEKVFWKKTLLRARNIKSLLQQV